MASCAACGKEISAESKFCVHCGHAMELPSAVPVSPARVEPGVPPQSDTSHVPPTESNDRGFVMRIVGSTAGFALLYVILMVPTYVLPYSGSNSAIIGAFGVAIGKGVMPQTWAHLWFLASLILVAWMRGSTVDKGFLPAISFCAALFDMTPVLNVIPLVPTVLHVVTLAIGVSGKSDNRDESALRRTGRRAVMATAATTLLAVGGSILFVTTAQKALRALGPDIAKPADPLREFKAKGVKPAPQVPQQQAMTAPPKVPAPTPVPTPTPIPVSLKPAAEPVTPALVVAAPPKPAAPVPVVAAPPKPAAPVAAVAAPPKSAAAVPVVAVPPKSAASVTVRAKPASTPVDKHAAPPDPQPASNPNKTAIVAMLGDANGCMASKRYDCAITNAKSILRLDPANAEAAQLQQRATDAQNQALQSISIR